MLRSISGELKKRGHEVGFVLSKEPNDISDPFVAGSFLSIFKIRRFIKKYDVIHAIDVYPYAVIAAVASVFLKKPFVLHCLGTYSLMPEKGGFVKKLTRWVLKRADHTFSVSDFTLKQMRLSGLDPVDPDVLPVGVDIKEFKESESERPLSSPYVLCVGAVKPRKGICELIEGFNLISKKHSDLKLVVIGSKDFSTYCQKVDKLIDKLGLACKVVLKEGISDEDLLSFYKHCEFFCLLPMTLKRAFEGFGLVFLEAGMMSKTSIGSLNSGSEAAIIHKETGLLVNAKHEDEVAKAMERLLTDSEFRKQLEQNAKGFALKHSWSNIVDRIEEIYKKLTSPSRTTN